MLQKWSLNVETRQNMSEEKSPFWMFNVPWSAQLESNLHWKVTHTEVLPFIIVQL